MVERDDSSARELNRTRYARRLERVLDHVEAELEGDMSLASLSRVAGLSRFHFHRQFRAYTGCSLARWITLLRLKRASYQLAFDASQKVVDIALCAGFDSPEGFARAFRRAMGQSPTEFRRAPHWERWVEVFRPTIRQGERTVKVDIIDFPETRVAAVEHRGSPATVMRSVQKFIAWRKSCDLSPPATSRTYGLAYDDPRTTPPQQYRFDICGTVEAPVPPNEFGVVEKRIPAGRCAVTRHHGSTDTVGETVHALFRDWLPQSGEEPRDFPVFFHNLQRMPAVKEHEQITDVYLPLT